jgi:hypothetical protein
MVEIERSPGQSVRIGRHTLRVVAVHPDRVVIALHGPDEECDPRGQQPAVPREGLVWALSGESRPAHPLLA